MFQKVWKSTYRPFYTNAWWSFSESEKSIALSSIQGKTIKKTMNKNKIHITSHFYVFNVELVKFVKFKIQSLPGRKRTMKYSYLLWENILLLTGFQCGDPIWFQSVRQYVRSACFLWCCFYFSNVNPCGQTACRLGHWLKPIFWVRQQNTRLPTWKKEKKNSGGVLAVSPQTGRL